MKRTDPAIACKHMLSVNATSCYFQIVNELGSEPLYWDCIRGVYLHVSGVGRMQPLILSTDEWEW